MKIIQHSVFLAIVILLSVVSCRVNQVEENYLVRFRNPFTKKYGYKDPSGKKVIKAKFKQVDYYKLKYLGIGYFEDHLYFFTRNGDLIDHKPYMNNDNLYDKFDGPCYRFVENEKLGFLDSTGKIMIPAKFDRILPFRGGFAAFYEGGTKDYNWGELEYWYGGKWGFLNTAGKVVIQPLYDSLDVENCEIFFTYKLTDSLENEIKKDICIPVRNDSGYYVIRNKLTEFQHFFKENIHNALISGNKNALIKHCLPVVKYHDSNKGYHELQISPSDLMDTLIFEQILQKVLSENNYWATNNIFEGDYNYDVIFNIRENNQIWQEHMRFRYTNRTFKLQEYQKSDRLEVTD
jgi:hypothetical protein